MRILKNKSTCALSAIVTGALLILLVSPVILLGQDVLSVSDDGAVQYTTSEAGDAMNYHVPAVRKMVDQWPAIDIRDYGSATGPGYHLLLASSVRLGASDTTLRWITLGLSALFVGLIAWFSSTVVGVRRAVTLCAPLLASSYVLSAASWVTTDNAALGAVSLAIGCAVFGGALPSKLAIGGLGATVAVAIRQIHVWTIAPLGLAAATGAGVLTMLPVVATLARRLSLVPRVAPQRGVRDLRLVVGAAACAAPLALVGWFIWSWGGLIPPAFRGLHSSGLSYSVPALTLSLCGILGMAFLPGAWAQVRAVRPSDPALLGAIAIGLLVAVAPATAWDAEYGRRFGWLWEIVKRAPSVADRSLVFVVCAPLGALTLVLLWRAAREMGRARPATILLFAGLCWCTAQMANSQAWQRYIEPPVLCGLIWLAACASPSKETIRSWPALVRVAWWTGPLMLAVMLGVVSVATIYLKVL